MENERLGEIRFNKYGTPMQIIEYKCADDITIKFLDVYERERKTTYSNFKSGCVRNPYDRNVKNVGKGKYREIESRDVLLTNNAKEAVIEWLKERGKIDNTDDIKAVFITKKLKRMTESDVRKMFKAASNSEITPHMMRHYYATIAAKVGGVVFAQQNLGHTSVNTTINNYANGSYGMKEILAKM